MTQEAHTPHGLQEIYSKLEGGLGHELVNDGNVEELIQMAARKGNATIETILREWRADCGRDDPDAPAAGARG